MQSKYEDNANSQTALIDSALNSVANLKKSCGKKETPELKLELAHFSTQLETLT